ncbi:hypothetical protein B0H19DRAFT_1058336 [Mycena capillaripes]|nr:hypothetical protein B0H19DRAFT_1058336 [Mycena capillaripes]
MKPRSWHLPAVSGYERVIDHLDFTQLDKCLQIVPLLTYFELSGADTELIHDLWAALSRSPSAFLPDLQILKIHHGWPGIAMDDFVEPGYNDLFHLLSTRRGRIVSFELVFEGDGVSSDYSGPDAVMCAAFRQLIARGMEVYIGDNEENFLEAENGDWDENGDWKEHEDGDGDWDNDGDEVEE